ncbi:MAG: conjugative transposon protein TraM [Cyclobacteriaceae bacterium]|tara:strand:- start:235049 stop:235939 length:891 start_codon:yes stop_codon:yes gene_type:complete
MNEKTKSIGLIIISILVMGAFVYFTFIENETQENELEGFINPEELDRTPLKQEIYEAKRKREKQVVNYDRKVTSLNDYLKNQINKHPFEDSAKLEDKKPEPEVAEISEPVYRKVQVRTTQKTTEKETDNPVRRTGFASGSFKSENSFPSEVSENISIPVVVQESTALENGSTIKLRMTETTSINGHRIPANTFVYGDVRIKSNTIQIEVESIPILDQILRVQLVAYDLSGNEGLIIEGGLDKEIKEDVLRETIDEVQDRIAIPILNNVPFRSARKQIRDQAIPIAAGYKFYLRDKL